MPSPKLYLNEHLSPRLADQLRQLGFDVVATHDAKMQEAGDEEQLERSILEERAVITFNHKDFALLHDRYLLAGKMHWGMIFSTVETMPVLRHRLLRLMNNVSAAELKNRILWLNDFK